MRDSINRIGVLLLAAFVLLVGALGYWAASGPSLTARPDNPRHILDEQRIRRGTIVDRDGEVIVETTGEFGAYVRQTLYPQAAPFAGYYSINYGTSGVEQAFDSTLRGLAGVDPFQTQIDRWLHRYPDGRDVQLTVDLDVQRLADASLGERDRIGAIVVLAVPGGDILALSSHPTFDPNTLDDNWDTLLADPAAPLLDRATQGQYQPGTALLPIILSEALRREVATLDDAPQQPTEPLPIDTQTLACHTPDSVLTLADAFRAACPKPFADLGAQLGSEALWELAATWELTATHVTGIQVAEALTQSTALTQTRSLREFAAGQGPLTVTPLHMARVAATLASRGEMPAPRIVSATQSIDGAWQPVDPSPGRRVLPAGIGLAVASTLVRSGDLAGYLGDGLSGPSRLHWFIGFAPFDQPKYSVAVLLEEKKDAPASESNAGAIGWALLATLIQAK